MKKSYIVLKQLKKKKEYFITNTCFTLERNLNWSIFFHSEIN